MRGELERAGRAASSAVGESPLFAHVGSLVSTVILPGSGGGVGGDTTAARFAAMYPEGEGPDGEALRGELAPGTGADGVTVTTTDARAHVAAEVDGDDIDATD